LQLRHYLMMKVSRSFLRLLLVARPVISSFPQIGIAHIGESFRGELPALAASRI